MLFRSLDARGRGAGGAYIVTEDDMNSHRKVVMVIVCSDEIVPTITETIRNAAHTGIKGDGIITVEELAEVIRIRTGEQNDLAV